jgi:hypothetical protein
MTIEGSNKNGHDGGDDEGGEKVQTSGTVRNPEQILCVTTSQAI